MRGDEPDDTFRNAGQLCDMRSTPTTHGLVYSLPDLCSNAINAPNNRMHPSPQAEFE
jgi:hypothetical protein